MRVATVSGAMIQVIVIVPTMNLGLHKDIVRVVLLSGRMNKVIV